LNRALERLLARLPLDDARVRDFVEEHEFPIVEDGSVTFFYRGAADAVNLRHWIFGLPSSQPFHRVDESDVWHLTMELPPCSRVEYKLERVVGEDRQWIMDPLNPRVAHDPYGANSVCYGKGYVTPEWTQQDSEARPGSLEALAVKSEAFGERRQVGLYLPARFRRTRRYPLLVVHDGSDYMKFAELKTVLDNLIHRLEIPPTIAALTRSPDRLREYAADPRHARFLTQELLPELQTKLPLLDRPAGRALVGASFGAVAALHTAWTHPGTWGGALLQSGSFAFSDIGEHGRGPLFDPVAAFVNAFRERPGAPMEKLFVSCGIYESLIYENRSLLPLLQSTKMDLRYVEARDGHNWDNWRDRLREGLSWLFPGPLWMVYE
jgi:enterochelin esterase family protein